MIVIGYPGIGKTTLAKCSPFYIDLESSCFKYWDEENQRFRRWDNWAEIYANVAVDLNGNHDVLVSSHKLVRDALLKHPSKPDIVVCCPVVTLKEAWIKRLQERYEKSRSEKDQAALVNAETSFTTQVNDLLAEGLPVIEIKSMDYKLSTLLVEYKLSLLTEH